MLAYELKIVQVTQGRSRSFKITKSSACVRSGLNVIMSCTVNDIFSVEYWLDFEMWLKGHLKVIENGAN